MSKIAKQRTFEQVLEYLRGHGFEVSGGPGRATVKKYGCSAVIAPNPSPDADVSGSGTNIVERTGFVLGGETARLVDKGYQKFIATSKLEIAATADHLSAMHSFAEELCEAMQATSLYNEALGTVSDRYVYDRIVDRDKSAGQRKLRPWEKKPA